MVNWSQATVLTNGIMLLAFGLGNGTRQGDPLYHGLFVLAIALSPSY